MVFCLFTLLVNLGASFVSMSRISKLQEIVGAISATALPYYTRLMDYRVAAYSPESDPRHFAHKNQFCVFVCWHETIATLVPKWAWCDLTLLVSQHRDAEWLNQFAGRIGFKMTRGSSTRGGPAALRRLRRIGMHSSLVFTPDGPKGPRRKMAPGALYVASKLQMPIVPVGVGVRYVRRLNTWDKFVVPFPGSKVRVIFGPKIYVPPDLERDQINDYSDSLANSLNSMTSLAQDWVERKVNLNGYRPQGHVRPPKKQTSEILNDDSNEDDSNQIDLPEKRTA